VLRTLLAELLQNSVDELTAVGRQRMRIAVYSDEDDVLIDLHDDGDGIGFSNPYTAFRRGRGTRDATRGRGLHDAEQLARRAGVLLNLVTAKGDDPYRGAHFRLALPRA
jgi:C4-dicarboxylate-specific signal transduction histidine kinase